ncbi:hypothetical protein LXA43DRAFT_1059721 [Ganoderma leucocontextum]|nr:hypothetical protein LXA43DRAFT_1059721 [Ganoderma leucocontextum]
MATTTTAKSKPARTTPKRASSANANVNSSTTLTLHLNVNADAGSRAISIGGNNATRRAKPQGGQTKGQNGHLVQTATNSNNTPPINQPRQNRPRTQQTQNNTTAAAPNHAPRPQQQRQPGSSQGAGGRSGNGGHGYVPRATSTPRQQPPWQDGQRLTSTTGALVPTSKALAVGNGKGRV